MNYFKMLENIINEYEYIDEEALVEAHRLYPDDIVKRFLFYEEYLYTHTKFMEDNTKKIFDETPPFFVYLIILSSIFAIVFSISFIFKLIL